MKSRPRAGLTWIYRWYDEADNLLYVGITTSIKRRTAEHKMLSGWFRYATRIEVSAEAHEVYRAEEIEAEAIRIERPLFNRSHGRCGGAGLHYLSARERGASAAEASPGSEGLPPGGLQRYMSAEAVRESTLDRMTVRRMLGKR